LVLSVSAPKSGEKIVLVLPGSVRLQENIEKARGEKK